MRQGIRECVVVGASRGLGAAIVQKLIDNTECRVYGISRRPLEGIKSGASWIASGRYEHFALDIASDDAVGHMKLIAQRCSGPFCVIFNAAHIEKDFIPGGRLDFEASERVNRVGIRGLTNILAAFEEKLLVSGGIFAGVTSYWGRLTPISLPYVSYPATKSYLDSVLRSLRHLWPAKISVVSIAIGNIKDTSGGLPPWLIPTYTAASGYIVSRLFSERVPSEIGYPFLHSLIYKYVLKVFPKRLLPLIFGLYLKLEASRNRDGDQ